MSYQYRVCQNCGASLTPSQGYCFHCGARYIEPGGQQPGVYQQYAPEQPVVRGPVRPDAAQYPGVMPPLEPKPLYPQQAYVPPPAPPPTYPANYARQAQVPPGPGQGGDSSPPPPDEPEQRVSPGVLIVLAVVGLLVLAGIVSLFYNIGQHSSTQPGSTPTPVVTPAPTHAATPAPTHAATPVPTHTPRSVPTRTPGITPTPTAFRAPVAGAVAGGPYAVTLARPGGWLSAALERAGRVKEVS